MILLHKLANMRSIPNRNEPEATRLLGCGVKDDEAVDNIRNLAKIFLNFL